MTRLGCRAAGLCWAHSLAAALCFATILVSPAGAGTFQRDFQDLLTRTPPGSYVSGLVMMGEQLDRNTLEQEIARQGFDTRWRRHQYVITTAQQLAARTQTDLLQTLESLRRQGRVRSYESFWITNMVAVDALPEVFRNIVGRPDLGTIYTNAPVELRAGVDVPKGNGDPPVDILPDNLICVNVQHAWDLGYHGEGRLVAVFDTGADGHHPALAAKWRGLQPGVQWWEAWKDPCDNTTFPYDSESHGTHVLGIMVAKKPDGTAIGVAPSAKWIAAGVLICGIVQKTIECYQWAADPDGDPSTIDDVPDVINNSWGSAVDCDHTYWNAIDVVEAAGIVNTIAVDNTGPNPMSVNSPESRAETPTVNFGVGDVDPHTAGYPIAQRSGRGPSPCDSISIKPEVTAPGEVIYSTLPNNGYGYKSGTSMACPHTSGAAALLRQVNPDLTVDEVKTILMSTATDKGVTGEDNSYGWGIINIGAAVDYAYSTLPKYPPTDLSAQSNANDVTLTWRRPARIYFRHPVQKYRLYRAPVGQDFPTNPVAEVTDTSAVVTAHDNGLAWGDYKYVVTAFYQNGESGPSNVASVHLALSAPTNLTAQSDADTVALAWHRPDPIYPGFPLESYRVWRAAAGDTFPHEPVATVTDTSAVPSYRDRGLRWGDYKYYVTALYQGGESAPTDTVQAHLALSAPTGLTAQAFADTVRLDWHRPDPIFPGIPLESYAVWRAVGGDSFPPHPTASFSDSAEVVTFLDTALELGTYRYVIAAVYQTGDTLRSNETHATVALDPPRDLTAVVLPDTVRLTWQRPEHVIRDLPVVSYRLFRTTAGDSFPHDPIMSIPDSSGVLAYADTTRLTPGRYQYVVTALYTSAESGPSNVAEADIDVPPPTGLTAVALADSIALAWVRPSGIAPTNPLQSYRVFRSAVNDSFPQNPLAEFADTSATPHYADLRVPAGSYRYRVVAVYQVATSRPSNVAYATANPAGVKDITAAQTAPLRAAPNPFNPTTVIHYRPIGAGVLRISVWDLRGALVRDLVVSASPQQTDQSVVWDGRDDAGRHVASGMYFVRMSQGGRSKVCRVTLLK